jgi:putative PIG3 family NAD(P)H quinone oxidoreductase
MPDTMTAISIRGGKGPAANLEPVRIAVPEPKAGQVLIRVGAAGVNRPDIIQRLGFYPPPPGAPETMGLEVAGEVAGIGAGVERWRAGDAVTALLPGGGYAEYAVVDARHALPVPAGLGLAEAASLPETVFTVWANVFDIGQLKAGETCLIHGATSGIGVAAIQMARAAGARVITTGRGADKARQAKGLGADIAIDASAVDWAEAVKAEGGADVILDMVGAAYAVQNIDVLKQGGRLVQIATLGGSKAEIDLGLVMRKRLTVTGSTLRPRDADEKARLARGVEAVVWPWIEAGKLKPIVDSTFPLEEAAEAHARMESGQHLGKIVLTVGD